MNHYDEFFKQQYEEIIKKLDNITSNLIYYKEFPDPIIDNAQFMALMGISSKTCELWRRHGIVNYVQIKSKIYFRISDVRALLDENYHKSTKSK